MPLDKNNRTHSFLVCAAAYACALLGAAVVCTVSRLPRANTAFFADLAATVVVFVFSVALDNSSLYDPYWSVAPVPLVLYWLLGSGSPVDTRQAVVTLLVLTWAARLTFNWVRRWTGLGDEDWRYAERRSSGAAYWPLSFVGFHMMPTVLVFFGCLPMFPLLTGAGSRELGALDLAAVVVTLGAVLVESSADRQIRRFLTSPRVPGAVLDTGLWALSRHPNYFGEVAFWWGIWLFGLASDPGWWWTIVEPAAITALFLGISIPLMDRRMLSRHPGYAAYRVSHSAFLPLPRRRSA